MFRPNQYRCALSDSLEQETLKVMAAPQQRRVLIVEDDERLANLVARYLRDAGFAVELEHRGDRVASRILETNPDLVLLDIGLPGISGFEVCRQIRPSFAGAIVMLTAKTEEIDEVLGLELGADDYLAKPVRPRALLTRINKLLAPTKRVSPQTPFVVGALRIVPSRREVTMDGEAIELTTVEYEMLAFLAKRPGIVVSREELYSELRGVQWDGLDRWADLTISKLRRKLGAKARIKTVRNRGYILTTGAE